MVTDQEQSEMSNELDRMIDNVPTNDNYIDLNWD